MNQPSGNENFSCGCLLPALCGTSLRGPLVGLKPTGGELHVEKSVFACCQGEGIRSVGAWQLKTCSLKQRLLDINFLWYRLGLSVGPSAAEELLRSLPPDGEVRLLQRLQKIATGAEKRGAILPARSLDQPSLIWYVALAATWRYGIRCHVVDWHAGSPASWAPPEKFWEAPKRMLLVAGVDQLWDPVKAFDLEWLIGLAYQSELPFWLGYSTPRQDPLQEKADRDSQTLQREGVARKLDQEIGSPRRKAFGAMLKKARDRDPIEWLSPDMRSKLGELCEIKNMRRSEDPRPPVDRKSERHSEK